jgi:hypothetical protein
MKTISCLVMVLGVGLLSNVTACDVGCIDDGSGVRCTGKSLKEFLGQRSAPTVLDRGPGAALTIDVVYGNVLVDRSASGKLEVEFAPFVYAGYDQDAAAQQMLTRNLQTTANGNSVTVARQGGSNGLGADVIVRLPDTFDGPLTVINRGDGPLNHFDLKVQFVGRASTLAVTNQSILGACWIQGAPTVRNTIVSCADGVSVFDVADKVDITNRDEDHDDPTPAVTVRLAGVSPGGGGRITSVSGGVAVTFPKAAYVVKGSSPVKGNVREGVLPAGCTKTEASPANKTITCGAGPTYDVIAGSKPDFIGQPKDSDVTFSWQ